jgi:hypothetical protein
MLDVPGRRPSGYQGHAAFAEEDARVEERGTPITGYVAAGLGKVVTVLHATGGVGIMSLGRAASLGWVV